MDPEVLNGRLGEGQRILLTNYGIFTPGGEGVLEWRDEPIDSRGADSWSVGSADPNKHSPYIHQGERQT